MKWHGTASAGSKQAKPCSPQSRAGFPQVVTQPQLKQSEVLHGKLQELKITSSHLPSCLRSQANLRALITKPSQEGGLEGCLVFLIMVIM